MTRLHKDGSVNQPALPVPAIGGHTLHLHPAFDAAMGQALDAARSAGRSGDVPIGAAVLHMPPEEDPSVVSVAGNARERASDPTAHAEVLALQGAAAHLGRWRLTDCVLVATLEPCPMCAGAAWAARIGGVVFGAVNTDAGATGSLYHLGQDPRLNHEFPALGGVRGDECVALLDAFFADHRR